MRSRPHPLVLPLPSTFVPCRARTAEGYVVHPQQGDISHRSSRTDHGVPNAMQDLKARIKTLGMALAPFAVVALTLAAARRWN